MFRSGVISVGLAVVFLNVADGRQNQPAPVLKPLVPAATTAIASNPDAFIGQTVTVTASVDRLISPTSFAVDQDPKATGIGDVLVLVEALTAAPEVNSYVTVIGEVVRHEGRPAIRATSVINAAMVDLAKRQAPAAALDPDEVAFDATMKRINPAFGGIRQAVAAGGGEKAAEQAAILKQGFTETKAFWEKRDKPDAVKWAAEARAHAETLEAAVTAGRWDEAKAAVGSLQQTCSACHGAYRQRGESGYRIRSDK